MTARLPALALVALLSAAACSPASPSSTPATTPTSPPVTGQDGRATSTTQLSVTGEGFQTRLPGVLVVGTERPVPPWYTSHSGGAITGGLEYRVAREIGSRLGVPNITVVRSSLVLMMTGQDSGCDLILSGVSITDGRARSLDLTEPYLDADQALLVRQGAFVTSIEGAAALRLAVAVHNSAGLDVIRNRIKPSVEPVVVVNEDEAARALADGRLDGVVLDLPDALTRVNADSALAVAGRIRTGEQYAVALSLGSSNTALVNEVIRDMHGDGTIDAIVRTYLGLRPSDVPLLP